MAAAAMIPWSRRAGHVTDALFSPLGGLMILLASLWGLMSRALGIGIQWKGRRVLALPPCNAPPKVRCTRRYLRNNGSHSRGVRGVAVLVGVAVTVAVRSP